MTVQVTRPRFEQRDDSLGVGTATPRLSWMTIDTPDDWHQAEFELECRRGTRVESTGRVLSDDSVLVAWPFAPLSSRERADVRVRVWAVGGDSPTEWSTSAAVEAGLLAASDWSARPITCAAARGVESTLCFRRELGVSRPLASARLYITALGVFEAEINGKMVSTDVLAPGWTVYSHRLRYTTHVVTDMLTVGANVIGITVAEGWYSGRVGFHGGVRNLYGDHIAAIAQLELTYEDGTVETIATDESWRCGTGPVVIASLYDGEQFDARLIQSGWSLPGFDASGWTEVVVLDSVASTLIAPSGPPVRRHEALRPTAIWTSPLGQTLVDFGQNISGRVRITVSGPAGTRVELRHAEVLEAGELGVRPLRDAAATDHYTLSGSGREEYEPHFTIHGFRYVQVTGWPGELQADDIVAVACYSAIGDDGDFECSHDGLNQLHRNVRWSMKGNFVDIPTDCPQRDERLGWTGDICVFTSTATFLADCAGFLSSWLADLAVEQRTLDVVPPYVPWVPLQFPPHPTAVWGDAAVVVPWTLYEQFGDVGVLERQYASMKAWVDQTTALSSPSGLWDQGFQFGDWLDPAAPPDRPIEARTEAALVATAYRAHSLRLVARTAAVLGNDRDAEVYAALAQSVVDAFNREFVTPSGRLSSDAQTAYAVAIRLDMLPTPEQRDRAGRRLRQLVAGDGHRIGTGFAGTPLVCDALVDTGHLADAFLLLLQTNCPSWLYPVTMGATTVWERWDSMLPDGAINPGEMTSFNHYALGAVASFLHRRVAGLAPAAPGYRRIRVEPSFGGGLTSASARHRTPYGLAQVSWTRTAGRAVVEVTVPPSCTAEVVLPGATPLEVTSGQHRFEVACARADQEPTTPPPYDPFGPPPEAMSSAT